jgi:hypothetical protein
MPWWPSHPSPRSSARRKSAESSSTLPPIAHGRSARLLVERRFAAHYEYALAAVKRIPYAVWREYDPHNTLTFYALRLRDAGQINSSPHRIIARAPTGTSCKS